MSKLKGRTTITSRNGWLSPEGRFYACKYYGHDTLAGKLGFEWNRSLHWSEGWLKVQNENPEDEQFFFYDYEKYPYGSPVHEIWRKMVLKFCAKFKVEIPFHFNEENFK